MTLPAIMTGAARVTQPPSRLPPELDPRGPGRSRPTRGSTGARARPGIARWLRWTAGGSALAVALVLVGGFAAYAYYSGRLGHVSIRLPGQAAPPDSDGPAQDFLIVGSDTRDFAGGQAFQASPGSADYVTGQRSDTVMLVHLPAGNTKATLVSFPRDSYVQIPAHPDEKGRPQAPYLAKLNEAFSVGGPAVSVSSALRWRRSFPSGGTCALLRPTKRAQTAPQWLLAHYGHRGARPRPAGADGPRAAMHRISAHYRVHRGHRAEGGRGCT